MNPQLVEIRDQQKASWNKFSSGWRKWNELTMDHLKPMGDEIIHLIHSDDNSMVLDIAAGTGEPGLTLASKMKKGKVIVTDLSEGMLAIARENAAARGLKNIETKVCDVCELPFADQTFDAISCRFGFMFFPDMQLAANEMHRVLKPGGKIAVAVWNAAEKNFWITAMGGTINRNLNIAPPPPGAPGMFRCAESGLMSALFQKSGFKNTVEKEVKSQLKCGDTDTYWSMMTEIAAPFVAALSKADDRMKAKIKEEVYNTVNQKYPDGKVFIDASALVISAEK
ncbi:MAG: methyltransferase domain-containing protein [Bacteroidetes bacterium]|nr:methyltransferase domain-containing protein [Bacteroidota bacterium]